jgi:hypothetical protein
MQCCDLVSAGAKGLGVSIECYDSRIHNLHHQRSNQQIPTNSNISSKRRDAIHKTHSHHSNNIPALTNQHYIQKDKVIIPRNNETPLRGSKDRNLVCGGNIESFLGWWGG